jgi:hypothetical protein
MRFKIKTIRFGKAYAGFSGKLKTEVPQAGQHKKF